MSSSCDNKIIVALDYDNKKQALELSKKLDPSYCRLKIGKHLFTKYGPTIVDELQKMNFEIFVDSPTGHRGGGPPEPRGDKIDTAQAIE